MRAGLRARILTTALAPVAVAGTLLLTLAARDHLALLRTAMAQEIRLAGERWREPTRAALGRGDRDTVAAAAELMAGVVTIARVRIHDRDGDVVAEAAARDGGAALISLLGAALADVLAPADGSVATVRLPLAATEDDGTGLDRGRGRPLGAIALLPSNPELGRRFIAAMLPPVALFAGLLAVAALAGLASAGGVVAPLRRLTRQARRLEAGDLEARIRRDSPGELGELEHASNRMASALHEGQQSLQNQVRQTTSELRQTLQAVEVQNVELDVARKRALEANKVKSEFLANVSHEVRTPINGIVGFADLLYHSPLDAEQRDYVNTIRESCTNLLTIVNDILDFSKIEAGKLVIDNVAFDLRDSVEEVLSLLAPAAYGKSLELVQLIYSDVPYKLYGDPIRIRQVLTNLVHNAIKFTPSGRIAVRVMLEDEGASDAVLRVTVTDTGIGLSPDNQAKLFRAFSQADTSLTRRFGGTGLGLIISRKLLGQMDGDIGLESEHGEGSTFWFTLRLQKQPGTRLTDAGAWKNPLGGRRVLLLDEEPLSRLALSHLLGGWGMQVDESDDRERFVALAGTPRRWDAVVLGLTRADLNARVADAMLERLRRLEAPLMLMASTVDRNELRALYQRGAHVCLPKAVRRQTVYRELCRLIAPESAPALPEGGDGLLVGGEAPAQSRRERAVLVVDDNRINRKLVTHIAERNGAHAVEAEDGEAAVARCRERHFDVIFMDIHMPGMSGEEAARAIREPSAGPARPRIVALTANAMPGERERLLEAGLDACLIKPVNEQQVIAAMEQADGLAAGPAPTDNDRAIPRETAGSGVRAEMRGMLAAELPDHRRAIRQAYRSGRAERLREAVHTLHGAVSVCDLPVLRDACRTLEEAVARGDTVTIPGALERLMAEIAPMLPESAAAAEGESVSPNSHTETP